MTATGDMIAAWWNTQERRAFVSILTGIFANALKSSYVNDISSETGNKAVISASAILDTKQLLGDKAMKLTTIAMNSAVYTALQKHNLIEYIPNSEGIVEFPTYLGYKVIVDDGISVVGGIYSTYLFTEGAFIRGEGVPESVTSIEIGRDILASEDILISRRAFCLHPLGLSWKNPVSLNFAPTNYELASGVNWSKTGDDKAIGMAMLKHKI